MLLKTYQYRIYPNNKQKTLINKHFGAVRWVYNYCLDKKIKAYQSNKTSLSCFDLINELPELRKQNEWLKETSSQSLQMSIRGIDNAFTKFFREKRGFPKFKSKKNEKFSFKCPQRTKVDFENNTTQLIKIGKIKTVFDRQFIGKIKSATVKKNNIEQYFVCILVETEDEPLKKKKINKKTTIGIDLGIKTFATISNGVKIENPKFLEKSEKRLAALQKRLSKKQKGSKNRLKAKFKVAKLHNKIKNQRSNFLHNFTYRLTHDNQVNTIAIENLNVNGMLKNHCLAKSIQSVSWSEFVKQLSYKCEWYGKNLLTIGRFESSSKMCSCGVINNELTLKDRVWTCKECKVTHDRDLLASQNIKKFALQKQNLINTSGQLMPAEPVELSQ